MQIAKWGNSLAVRLPARLVRELGLKEGDEVEITGDREALTVTPVPEAREILDSLRDLRGRLRVEDRLSRDAAHER